jgi:hypothetical protein
MSNKDKLILRTPEQQNFVNPEAILTLSGIKSWLASMPILKPVETVDQVFNMLTIINLQPLPSKKRQPILNEFRSLLVRLFPLLEMDALKRQSLKQEGLEQLYNQITSLFMALADGYKIIIKELLLDKAAMRKSGLGVPLFHAVEACALALANSFRVYQAAPVNLYQDIHQLYLLAEHSGVLETDIDTDIASPAASNIADLYCQIMTLAFLDPYRMPANTSSQLFIRLASWANYCEVLKQLPDDSNNRVYVTELNEDTPPLAAFKVTEPDQLSMPRIISIDSMCNKIQAEMTSLQSQEQDLATKTEIDLLSKLIPVDQQAVTRQAERQPANHQCIVTFGLDAVNCLLGLSQDTITQLINKSADSFMNFPLQSWTSSNESETGISLYQTATNASQASVGDLIGLLTEHDVTKGQSAKVAVIRWLRHDDDSRIHIGLEFLNGQLHAATCETTQENQQITCPAIYISTADKQELPATLLTPKKHYRRGRQMTLYIGEHTFTIKAGFLRDDTFIYDRFDFTKVP